MITVLLSTYNSERYLRDQIESILQQRDVEVSLIARDDGSKDSTINILNRYQSEGKLQWYSDGFNLKPARAFMRLLKDTNADSEYFAFSDHDDVWLDDKLKTAEMALSTFPTEEPALYFCQTKLVDANLQPFKKQIIIRPYCTLGESLINHFIGGCTMVFNKALRDIVMQYEPEYLNMHDIWIYLIAQAVGGHIVFDPVPHILYRQHGHNEIGQGYNLWRGFKRHYKRLILDKEHVRQKMAKEVLQGYRDLIPDKNRLLIEKVANYDISFSKRISALTDSRLDCHNRRTFFLSKIAFLLGTI